MSVLANDGTMPVGVLVGDAVARVGPEATLLDVTRALADADVGALVMGEAEVPGVVSERDVVRALAAGHDPGRPRPPTSPTGPWCGATPTRRWARWRRR